MGEAELHWVGDCDDLHDVVVGELLYVLAHCRFRQVDCFVDGGVGAMFVFLELLDDCFGCFVYYVMHFVMGYDIEVYWFDI